MFESNPSTPDTIKELKEELIRTKLMNMSLRREIVKLEEDIMKLKGEVYFNDESYTS